MLYIYQNKSLFKHLLNILKVVSEVTVRHLILVLQIYAETSVSLTSFKIRKSFKPAKENITMHFE